MRVGELKKKILARNEGLELQVKKDLAFQVARHFEDARLVKGWTQAKLAEEVGTSQSNIARAENGNSLPSLSFLKRVAEAYKTYLIPPKFAFMEELKAKIITTTVARDNLKTISLTHFYSSHPINASVLTSNRDDSYIKGVNVS